MELTATHIASSVRIVLANPEHAAAIVRVIRDEFAAHLGALMIYGCSGIADFIRAHLSVPRPLAERELTVALADDQVIGCADMQIGERELFLSYIATSSSHRGGGIASRLLYAVLRSSRRPEHAMIGLDVFTENPVARAWYERLGFVEQATSEWRVLVTDVGAPAEPAPTIRVTGFPQAEAAHARYGFSRFFLSVGTRSYDVGRLGERWFRVMEPAALGDHHFRSALHRLDPARQLLAIVPAGSAASAGSSVVARSIRLVAPIELAWERLSQAREGAGHRPNAS